MKKIISIILCVLMIASSATIAFAADKENTTLKFNENGKFKILIFADIQDGFPTAKSLIPFMEQAMDEANPDLIVFLGDNVMAPQDGYEKTVDTYYKGYDVVLEPIVERGIPFTFVFGNHDKESFDGLRNQIAEKEEGISQKYKPDNYECKELILKKFQEYKGCLAYDAVPELHGCANHNLPILSSDGTRTAYNLWMLDSGDYIFNENLERANESGGYDCVRKDQLQWYKQVSERLEAENGRKVPSLMFQHIVPREVAENVMFTVPFQLGEGGNSVKVTSDGKSITFLPNYSNIKDGFVTECPCPSMECDGQWDAIVERGDVKGVFFGHDHKNNFVTNLNGVDGVNVPGSTYSHYYSKFTHGALLLTLDEATGDYEREMLYSNDLALEEGSLLPELDRSKASYLITKILRFVLEAIAKIFRFPASLIR